MEWIKIRRTESGMLEKSFGEIVRMESARKPYVALYDRKNDKVKFYRNKTRYSAFNRMLIYQECSHYMMVDFPI